MQDLAETIASRLEPSEPTGHRLLIHRFRSGQSELCFDAVAVKWAKGECGMCFVFKTRCEKEVPGEFSQMIAPNTTVLKGHIREMLNQSTYKFDHVSMQIVPPWAGNSTSPGVGRDVDLGCDKYHHWKAGGVDDPHEKILDDAVSALMTMKVPPGMKWV